MRRMNRTNIRIGYACLALGVPDTELHTCTVKTATPERLRAVTAHNLAALSRLIEYNAAHGIRLFRISSDLVPFGSAAWNSLRWDEEFAAEFAAVGERIRSAGLRVSMHPGQYTVLNSPKPDVVAHAAADLRYHERVLRLLGAGQEGRLVLHVGGVYGDKAAALRRFRDNWAGLDAAARGRIVLENDERCFHIADVLGLCSELHVPAVFDNLHHALNPPPEAAAPEEWIRRCAETWTPADGPQKIHYSQQSEGGRPGAHSRTIRVAEFLPFVQNLRQALRGRDLDLMLEVKDKNLSALRCMHAAADPAVPAAFAEDWAFYRLGVLERAPRAAERLEAMLADGVSDTAAFYTALEEAVSAPAAPKNAAAAARAVWGMLGPCADAAAEKRFESRLGRFENGTAGITPVKALLRRRAEESGALLRNSYYFL